MRRNIFSYILLVMVAGFFSSCEKTVNLNIPAYTPRLVIQGQSQTGDNIWLDISHSQSIKDHNNFYGTLQVPDATALLYTNGVLTDTFMYDITTSTYKSHTPAETGKSYEVKVSASGYTTVSATSAALSLVPLSAPTFTRGVRKDQDGHLQDMLSFSFADGAVAGDYYIIKIIPAQFLSQGGRSNFCVNTPDASVETVDDDLVDINTCVDNNGIYLRDELFNGQTKNLKVYVPADMTNPVWSGTDSVYYYIELDHVTEQAFKYEKSYRTAINKNGDPFSEPANVYTNISNGYGIFGISGSFFLEIK